MALIFGRWGQEQIVLFWNTAIMSGLNFDLNTLALQIENFFRRILLSHINEFCYCILQGFDLGIFGLQLLLMPLIDFNEFCVVFE